MNSEDYRELFVQVLSPPGPALPRHPSSRYAQLLHAFGDELARVDAFVAGLQNELDPSRATALLPEWEATTGLPDPCTGQLPSLEARRAAVVQKLTTRGRLDKQFLIDAAEVLGFTIDAIVEYDALVAGTSEAGEEVADQDSQFVVDVETPAAQVFEPEVGGIACGDPLGWIGNSALGCLLERIKPAHVYVRIVLGA